MHLKLFKNKLIENCYYNEKLNLHYNFQKILKKLLQINFHTSRVRVTANSFVKISVKKCTLLKTLIKWAAFFPFSDYIKFLNIFLISSRIQKMCFISRIINFCYLEKRILLKSVNNFYFNLKLCIYLVQIQTA